jgi:hypothetical protein
MGESEYQVGVGNADPIRVARVSMECDTKTGKKLPNEHKVLQMFIKYINIFQYKALKNLPKLGILV